MDPLSCEQVCRICASHGTDYTLIFDATSDGIGEKINQCLPISVSKYDKLPLHICSECLNDLIVSYELREKSLESDQQSREQFNSNGIHIKSEKDHNADDNDLICCAICEINFDNTVQFNGHMKELHSSEWTCDVCEGNFKTSDDLFQHKNTNHYNKIVDCDEADDNIDKLATEADVSIDADKSINRKDKGPPPTTDNPFTTKPALKTVMICDICNVSVKNEREMGYHRKFHAPHAVTCSLCEVEYPSAYHLFLHRQDVHKNYEGQRKRYYCETCEKFISCFAVLRNHFNCKYVKLKCQYCDREFRKKYQLEKHQRIRHRKGMLEDLNCQKWNCSECGKIFISQIDYRRHVLVHTNVIDKKYECKKCNKFFSHATHLKYHLEGFHDKVPKYQCEVCFKRFCARNGLKTHEKRHRTHMCQECNKQFQNFDAFSAHMKKAHKVTFSVEGPFACKQCPRKFSRMRQLQDHENIHSGEEPYSCEICHQTFRTYAARWAHVQRHRTEAYTCDHCKREFKTKTHLARHILCHLPKENWKYRCKVCKARFKTNWHRHDHMKVHSAAKT